MEGTSNAVSKDNNRTPQDNGTRGVQRDKDYAALREPTGDAMTQSEDMRWIIQLPQMKELLKAMDNLPDDVTPEQFCYAYGSVYERLPDLRCEEVQSAFNEALYRKKAA